MKAPGQYMLEKSAQELMAGESHNTPFICVSVFVLEGDVGLIDLEYTGVGNGDTVYVAPQIVHYVFYAKVNVLYPKHPLIMFFWVWAIAP